MSGGMCSICKVKPAKARADGRCPYCNDCENRLQRQRYYNKRATKNLNRWRSNGTKKPPTDWREVLRKAEEQKP